MQTLFIALFLLGAWLSLFPSKSGFFQYIKYSAKILWGFVFALTLEFISRLFPPEFRVIIVVFTFLFLLTFIQLIRGIKMFITCKKCEFDADWDTCPGMGEISQALEKVFEKSTLDTNPPEGK